jgi:prepilin-type N-terminal cleavage/methylation domain-containing protein
MKKIHNQTKSGFTLLEVLLAVVILTIASTMIMKGFIAVMIFGRNNRVYYKYGSENYRAAMAETVAKWATNSSQADTMANLTDGSCSALTASYDPSYAASVTLPNIVVDVSDYSTINRVYLENVATGTYDDGDSSVSNRFAFFYDFGDFLGVSASSGHVIRWGFVFNPAGRTTSTAPYDQPVYVDKNNNGKVGADDPSNITNELVGYGRYGWYCFNPNHGHDESGTYVPDACRYTPFTPAY